MTDTNEKPYQVYHLSRNELDAMERECRGAERTPAVKLYEGLLSGEPRVLASDIPERIAAASQERMKRKCISAEALLEAGFYEKVCSVDADCAKDVFEMTNDINTIWCLRSNKKIELHVDMPRSTYHYDIIKRFGKPFMFMPMGIIDLQARCYDKRIV